MAEESYKVDEVFGINREIPLNYVERAGVDDAFLASLQRKKHIVIYGSSKQEKTSIRKKHLNTDQYILVSCQSKWDLEKLCLSILKQSNFKVELTSERAIHGSHKVNVSFEGKIGLPLVASGKGGGGYEHQSNTSDRSSHQPLSLDPLDVNDLVGALKSINFQKYIILEDFHYLPQETQVEFSYTLKSFHENSDFVFITVGVWREENRLIGFNGDLTDRVQSINADAWTEQQLTEVIRHGEELLNIRFDKYFKSKIIESSLQTVHMVQEACRTACLRDQVLETIQTDTHTISANAVSGIEIVGEIVDGQSGRYQGALQNIAEGFQETDLAIPRWIIYALLCFELSSIENGVKLRSLSRAMKAKHPRGKDLNNGSITQTLKALGSLQNAKNVRPLIFDYDTSNRTISIVDKGFVIWLRSQQRNQIAEELDLPELMTSDELEEAIG